MDISKLGKGKRSHKFSILAVLMAIVMSLSVFGASAVQTRADTQDNINQTIMFSISDDNNRDGKRPEKVTVEVYEINYDDNAKQSVGDFINNSNVGNIVKSYEMDLSDSSAVTDQYGSKSWDLAINDLPAVDSAGNTKVYGVKVSSIPSIVQSFQSSSDYVKSDYYYRSNKVNGSLIDYPGYILVHENFIYAVTGSSALATSEMKYRYLLNHTPEKVTVKGEKIWNDGDNFLAKRVKPDSVTVKLLADGSEIDSKEVTADDNWEYEFSNLNKYEDGNEIDYTVEEVPVTGSATNLNGAYDGYKASYEKKVDEDNNTIEIDITNTWTGYFGVRKKWSDDNNRDGKRPESITINLYKLKDFDSTTGLFETMTKIDSVVLTEAHATTEGNWEYVFDNLELYEDGEMIVYGISESDVVSYYDADEEEKKGYTFIATKDVGGNVAYYSTSNPVVIDGKEEYVLVSNNVFDIPLFAMSYYTLHLPFSNIYTPEKLSIKGEKIWNDGNDKEGMRPDSVTINLLKNGEVYDTKTITENDDWSYEFTNLYKYEEGEEIEYTLEELSIDGYDTEYTTTVDDTDIKNVVVTTDITNSVNVEVPVTKVWEDADNNDGKRPTSVTVRLLADGQEYETYDLVEAENWSHTFTKLPKYNGEDEINYTIEELSVPEYTSEITGDADTGYTIKNIHKPELIEISGKKIWDDADNQDGKRQNHVTVRLLKNGEEFKKVTITDEDNWQYSFKDLYKFEDGNEIEYSISESPVAGYTKELIETDKGFDIKNSYTPELVDITVDKTWDDGNNQDGKRPDKISVKLFADNIEAGSAELKADASGKWTYTFTQLPKYKGGKEISYTVKEDSVAGYTASQDGLKITNIHTPETVDISGVKSWDDADNQDGLRPAYVIIKLLADGTEIKKQTITEADDWKYSFEALPKYKEGKEIVYKVQEDTSTISVSGYRAEVSGYNITNIHIPEKTEVNVTKKWSDNNNQDGIRPASIKLTLLADGVAKETAELKAESGWEYSFTNLDKFKDGKEIAYTVKEDTLTGAASGYTANVSGDADAGFTITNTYTPALTEVKMSKVWDDANNQDGKRPDSVTFNLLADGEVLEGQEKTIAKDAADTTVIWTALPKNKAGKEIVYTVEEAGVTDGKLGDYAVNISGNASEGFTITNTYTPEKTKVKLTKKWNDNNNQDGIRPTSVKAELLADGEKCDEVSLEADNEWTHTFSGLPKYKDGKEIVYTVQEDALSSSESGYTAKISGNASDGFTITNVHTPEKTEVSVAKIWNDNNNQDGKRSASVVIKLLADGQECAEYELKSSDEWKHTFTDLPKYNAGKEIAYTVQETALPSSASGYRTTVSGDAATGYTVTNTYDVEKISLSGTKLWEDADNQDGVRPGFVTVRLLANGKEIDKLTLTKEDNWKYEFSNLDKYAAGKEVSYTVTESPVAGYEGEIIKTNKGFDIKNTHTPETVNLTVEKTWDDAGNQDGKRPGEITANLLADGVKVQSQKIKVNAEGKWTFTFTDLPKYKGGKEIVYSVSEEPVAGYTAGVEGFKITNVHSPETVSVAGSKTWSDGNNQDGLRPAYVTVKLLADGAEVRKQTITAEDGWKYSFESLPKYKAGKEIIYSIDEIAVDSYETEVSGYDIKNTHIPESTKISVSKTWNDADNKDELRPAFVNVTLMGDNKEAGTVVLGEDNNWAYTWENLPKKSEGKDITYTVKEEAVAEYTTEITKKAAGDFEITNTHVPAEPEKTEVKVTKSWNDDNNRDGKRPEKVEVKLFADGEEAGKAELIEAEGWTYTWTGLDKLKDGKEIAYTVQEDTLTGSASGYSSEVSGDATAGFTITNTHAPEKLIISGTKSWEDADNQDNKRPGSIKINLKKNGKITDSKTVGEVDKWNYEFKDLYKYENGEEITYEISEEPVSGYATTVTGYDVTNTYTPETTKISVIKTWDDAENQDKIRPASVKVTLMGDGKEAGTAVLNEDNNWAYTWEKLPKKSTGKDISYTVTEAEVSGYTADIIERTTGNFEIINTHKTETKEVTVTKNWVDADNRDGKRPERVTVRLYADGKEAGSAELTAENNWAYTWTGLDKLKDGKEIAYTVDEAEVSGYDKNVDGYTITNTYIPELTTIKGRKSWEDDNNRDGVRPTEVTVKLLANGSEITSMKVDESNSWEYEFKDLPVYEKGEKITYTIEEDVTGGYTPEISGYDLVNKYSPEMTQVKVSKAWNDSNNQDGKRPDKINVTLLANGVDAGKTAELSAKNDWTFTWEGLPKKENGKDIAYTVSEASVPEGYTQSVSGDATAGYTITNSYTTEKVDVMGVKTWNDDNNRDGKRPAYVKISLLKNGVIADTKTATADDNWSYSWNGLDKYANGALINYGVVETAVDGYTSVVDGYNIANNYTPEETGVTVIKVWDDADDKDGIRPESISVSLRGNGGSAGTAVLSEKNNWTYTWTGLPKYENGEKISYTVAETETEGYTCTITGSADTAFVFTNKHEPKPEVPVTAEVALSKKDATTGDELPGAVITIRNEDGMIVANWKSEAEPHKVVLEAGKYTMTEDTAPLGYAKTESVTFTVEKDGSVSGTTQMLDAPNVVNISKQEVGGGPEIDNAKLTVKGLSNDFTESWTSGGAPHVIERIPEGVYTLTEVTAPEGYDVAETMVFRINEDGTVECLDGENWIKADSNTVVMFDAHTHEVPKEHKVEISKKDATTLDELPGAKLIVRDAEGEKIDQWTSSDETHFVTLKEGEYTLTELTAPDGYIKAETITFTVNKDGLIGSDKVEMINASQKVYDMYSVNVTLEKLWKDSKGEVIDWPEGAKVEFVLQYKDGKGNWKDFKTDSGDPYTVILTADNTSEEFKELPAIIDGLTAVYRAVEISETENFKLEEYNETDLAAKKGDITVVNASTAKDEPEVVVTPFDVYFSKTDIAGKEIEGAKMLVKDSSGEIVEKGEWISTTKEHKLSLVAGTYVMTEEVAPEGYNKVTTIMTFVVNEDGTVRLVTSTVDNGGKIEVLEGNHVILSDAPANKEEGEEPAPEDDKEKKDTGTENEEKSVITKKTGGSSTRTSTSAQINAVKQTGSATVSKSAATGTSTKASSTGDNNDAALWVFIAVAAVAVMAGTVFAVRRKGKN